MSKAAQAQDVLTFTSVSHNFGSDAPGGTVEFGIKATNSSATTPYLNFALNISGSGASAFSQINNCPASLAPGANCEIIFTFTAPASAGTYTATWNLTGTGDSTFSYSPALPGTLIGQSVVNAGLTLTTSVHNFGTQLQYTTGPTYGVVLTNSISHPVTLSIGLTPAGYQNFPFQHNNYNCPAVLQPNQSCNLQWQFFPSAGNSGSGQPTPFNVTFPVSGVDQTTGQNVIITSLGNQVGGVTLIGYGITGSNYLLISKATNNFGNVANGSKSGLFGIQLINTTSGTVSITYGESGNYTQFPIATGANNVPANNCVAIGQSTGTLASGASCQQQFFFQPTTTGAKSATYSVTATEAGNPVHVLDQSNSTLVTGVTLTGNSVSSALTLSSAGHNFGPWVVGTTSGAYGTTLSYPICTGPGCSTQDPVNLSFAYSYGTGTVAADFPNTVNPCGAQITAGQTCNLSFTFSPQAATVLSATYVITATDSVNSQPVAVTAGGTVVQGISLAGTGQANAQVSLATSSHNFGEQGIGGSSATYGTVLYNTSGATVQVSVSGYSNPSVGAQFPGQISGMASNCPANLPNNSSCNLQWKFMPTQVGPLSVVAYVTVTQFGSPVPIIDLSTGNTVSTGGVTLTGTGAN